MQGDINAEFERSITPERAAAVLAGVGGVVLGLLIAAFAALRWPQYEVLLFPEAGTNVASRSGSPEHDEKLFDGCDVVVSERMVNPRVAPCPLEVRADLVNAFLAKIGLEQHADHRSVADLAYGTLNSILKQSGLKK